MVNKLKAEIRKNLLALQGYIKFNTNNNQSIKNCVNNIILYSQKHFGVTPQTAGYMALKNEISIHGYLPACSFFPVCPPEQSDRDLQWFIWDGKQTPNNVDAHGIRCQHPTHSTAQLPSPLCAFIPCVAATLDGHRLGRGKGYYDHFLNTRSRLGLPTYAVGCVWERALLESVPQDPWDRPVQSILTEKRWIVLKDI